MDASSTRVLPCVTMELGPLHDLPMIRPVCSVDGCEASVTRVLLRSDERMPRSGMCESCWRLFGTEVVVFLRRLNGVLGEWLRADSGRLRLLAVARQAGEEGRRGW